MRTTIDLPDDLFRKVKARAALDGLKLKDLVTRYVERGLASTVAAPPNGVSVRKRSPLPIIPEFATGKPIPTLTNSDLYQILEDEDAERYGIGNR
jgi:hypothetical protein